MNRTKTMALAICALFFLFSLQAQKKASINFDINLLEARIDSLLMQFNDNEPGMSIGIVIKNKLVIQKQIGLANAEHQVPITPKTSFHVASVSKQFTAFAILLLEDAGKLSQDDDIRKYIPEMHEFEHEIKIKDLLNHTSGIKDQWNLLRLSGWRLKDLIRHDHVLNILYNQTSLNFEPNEEFMYSNSGFTLLAEIVSRVSGISFSEFMEKRIFQPLNMNNSQFVDKEGQIINNKANSYRKNGENYIKDTFENYSYGATNLSTTIEDLSKWVVNFNQKAIGSSIFYDHMNTQKRLNNDHYYGYANGQFINHYKGIQRIQHSGQDASYQAYIGRFPEVELSIIFFNNNGEINGGKVVSQLIEICFRDYVKHKRYDLNKEIIHNKKDPMALSAKKLKAFEGYYWNEKDRYARQLKVENDTLYYLRNSQEKTALIPVDKNEFEMDIDEYLSLRFTSNQVVLTLNDGYQIKLNKYVPAAYDINALQQFTGRYRSSELNADYTFFVQNHQLIANHTRLGNFKLKAIKNDYFIGYKGSIQKVVFLRNKLGKVVGAYLSSSRAKNVRFDKINE